jgi:hypothetical protein
MSAKPINEYSGKELLYRSLEHVQALCKPKAVKLDEESNFNDAIQNCEWLKTEKVKFLFFSFIFFSERGNQTRPTNKTTRKTFTCKNWIN